MHLGETELSQIFVTFFPSLIISLLLTMLPVLLCLGVSTKTCLTKCLVSYILETFVLCMRRDLRMDLSAPWGKSGKVLVGGVV